MYNTTPIQEAPPKVYTFILPFRPFGTEVTPGSGKSKKRKKLLLQWKTKAREPRGN